MLVMINKELTSDVGYLLHHHDQFFFSNIILSPDNCMYVFMPHFIFMIISFSQGELLFLFQNWCLPTWRPLLQITQ